ncbi:MULTISPECIES: hypothetical protein [unclassified Streptomyces]|uniref:hypothetical protein n=1 Tax=unclassified Streptomyces TaxID=2593676 RepID=UPI00324B557E
MEAEVLAALVATPAVLVTGGAAFFAGRAQARAALRGPVDSVRRSAQRDAYAGLLSAARAYVRRTEHNAASRELGLEGVLRELSNSERQDRIVRFRAQADLEPVRHAVAVVSLEGPEHLVPLAEAIEQRAEAFRLAAYRNWSNCGRTPAERRERNNHLLRAYGEVEAAIPAFVTAARAHLNGVPPSA